MKKLQGKLTYANVVSTLCLFLLLGGGAAVAAGKLGKNTVGTKQLKTNAVTTAKIKDGAVTGSKVAAGAIETVPNASHAANADHATNAGRAANADYAAAAGNAATVGGLTEGSFASASNFVSGSAIADANKTILTVPGQFELEAIKDDTSKINVNIMPLFVGEKWALYFDGGGGEVIPPGTLELPISGYVTALLVDISVHRSWFIQCGTPGSPGTRIDCAVLGFDRSPFQP